MIEVQTPQVETRVFRVEQVRNPEIAPERRAELEAAEA